MMPVHDFESRIVNLDLTLFNAIPTQSSNGDRVSWLTIQRAVRMIKRNYVYLEIGSHLGGSIQQYLSDPKCQKIYSIDKRPLKQHDDRGAIFSYEGNSTERMIKNLKSIDEKQLSKVVCFDSDAKEINLTFIEHNPDLCFIDGEHTKSAVLSDFEFCTKVCSEDAVIYFHDDWIIYPAIAEIFRHLKQTKIPFETFKLNGSTFAIVFAGSPCFSEIKKAIKTVTVATGYISLYIIWLRYILEKLFPNSFLSLIRQFGKWVMIRKSKTF